MIDWLKQISDWVWGPLLLILLMGTGLVLTIRLRLIQFVRLPLALKLIVTAKNDGEGDVTSFAALSTALAATVGTGNIVGVATAIQLGGPGALFWMWMAALVGMATKYAEGVLAVKYRTVDDNGQFSGGPMYYIERGLGPKFRWLAVFFAVSGVLVALFGIGTFPQVQAIVDAAKTSFHLPIWLTALLVTVLAALVVIGGLQSIAKVAAKIVPSMAVLYIVICMIVLIAYADQLPQALHTIITSAFTGTAATGGFAGAGVMLAIRSGVARGIFSNESGLGSAPHRRRRREDEVPGGTRAHLDDGNLHRYDHRLYDDGLNLGCNRSLVGNGGGSGDDAERLLPGDAGSRSRAADDLSGALCLYDDTGLELLRGAVRGVSVRRAGHQAVPLYFHPDGCLRSVSEAGCDLADRRYCEWADGLS